MNGKSSLIVVTLLLAFALRMVAIDQIPPGLSHDEAYNGVTALQALEGQRLIFFEINKGIEPLIIYLEALAFYAFGIGPVPLRLVNVICGMLTVALVYPLTARLFNRRVAWLAMAGVAVSFWAVFVSRLTLRAITLPPLLILTLYFLQRGLTQPSNFKSQIAFFILSGLAAGASMYTYLASRFIPVLIIIVVGYQALRRQLRSWQGWGVFALFLIWALLFTPLAGYYLEHPDNFAQRAGQVTTVPQALNGEFEPLLRNTLRTLGMFTWGGDTTDRYNLDGRPIFDWANGLLFYLGVSIAVLRLRRSPPAAGPAALLLSWAFCMLLPDFITDDSPHFLRTIGALPVVYIFWALGAEQLSQWANHYLNKWRIGPGRNAFQISQFSFRGAEHASRQMRSGFDKTRSHLRMLTPPYLKGIGPKRDSETPQVLRISSQARYPTSRLSTIILTVLWLGMTVHTGYDYFGRWAAAPEARAIYGADIAEVARYLKTAPDEGLIALSAEYYRDLDPFRLALHLQGHPPFIIWFDGRQTLAFPPAGSNLAPRYIFSASAPAAEIWQPFLRPSPAESGREYTLYRLPDEATLRQAQATTFPAENRLGLNINDDLILSAYRILGAAISGGKFQVLLGWQALRPLPPGADYTFLVRLRDRRGRIWAEADGNGYVSDDWQPGVQALQLLTLRLPGDLPPRSYQLTVEVIDRQKRAALATPTGETVIPLGVLTAQLARSPRLLDPDTLPNPTMSMPSPGAVKHGAPHVALRGYEIHDATLHPGETLSLTLHWQILTRPEQNYRLKFFLVADEAQTAPIYHWPSLAPVDGEWPTQKWPADYWVQDRVNLTVGPDVPTGQFNLGAAWVDESGRVFPAGSHEAGFQLGLVTIEGGR